MPQNHDPTAPEETPDEAHALNVLYRTITTRDRPGPYGTLVRAIAAHPLLAGATGGLLAVGIAATRGWRGASTMPEAALVISVLVIAVWTLLFWFMRGFFAQQATQQVEVVRRLLITHDATLRWEEHDTPLRTIPHATWHITRATGDPPKTDETPWTVWLIATPHDATEPRFTLETRLMWREATHYPIEAHTSDERLPTHILSPLLEMLRP